MVDVSRNVEVDILARDKTGPAAKSAARTFDRLDKKTKDQAQGLSRLAAAGSRAFGKLRSAGDRWASDGQSSGARFAGRAVKALGSLVDAGTAIGGKMMAGMSAAVQAGGPYVTAAVAAVAVAAGVAAAAAIGAAISTGVLLAVGGGILAVGIMRAAKDPKVAAAWKTFGATAKSSLSGFAEPFKGPLIRAAATFSTAIRQMGGPLKELGKIVAPVIDKLAPSVATFAQKLLPGLKAAAQASMPLFDTLADHMPKIGEAVSFFLDAIAKEGPSANLFFDHLLTAIEATIKGLGVFIGWLTRLYAVAVASVKQVMAAFAKMASYILNQFHSILQGAATAFAWVPGVGPKLQAAAAKFGAFRDSVNAKLAGIRDRTVKVTIEQVFKMVGRPFTSLTGIGGSTARGYADSSYAPADGNTRSRAGGPTTVDVSNTVNVMLDGTPFRAIVATATKTSAARQAWRLQVGSR